jgi:hypothetical protein
VRFLSITSVILMATIPDDLAAQRSGAPGPVNVAVRIDGKSHEASGAGSCRHTPNASIYDVPAALWMAEYGGGEKGAISSVNLTLWRPKNGNPEQLSLSVSTRSSSHRISVGGRGEQVGSGKAEIIPEGAGGRLQVQGKDDSGKALQLVITCPVFAGVQAEGG